MDALGGWGMVGDEGCGIEGVDGEGIEGVGIEGLGVDGCGIEGEGIDGDGELGDGGCGMLGSLGIDGDDGACCGWGCRGCGCVWFVWHACSVITAVATTRQRISAWVVMAERPVFV
jgi:hypothetical protein